MPQRATVLVCRSSGCRKKAKPRTKLATALEHIADVEWVRCQKVCKGPVIGVTVDGTLEWFRRVNDRKSRRALVALLMEGRLKKRLRKQRVVRLSGKQR
jgi:(2Fe-2S) ferredoxin